MRTSIVSYFTDSSRIAAVYAIITLIILKESFDNQKVDCMSHLEKDKSTNININNVCQNRILYSFSSLKEYYKDEGYRHKLIQSSSKLTINIEYFTSYSNYFLVPYLHAIYIIIILSTTAISPHLLPISFYLINDRTTNHFIEWEYFSYSSVYEIFNRTYYLKKQIKNDPTQFSNNYDFYDWKSNDKIVSKEIYYTDPYYPSSLNKIFGYGGYCHYRVSYQDIKRDADSIENLFCFRTERGKNMFLLIVYWILIQGMFIASLWKEIILLVTFLISLFFKYGLIRVYERCYLKYFRGKKENNDNIEMISVD